MELKKGSTMQSSKRNERSKAGSLPAPASRNAHRQASQHKPPTTTHGREIEAQLSAAIRALYRLDDDVRPLVTPAEQSVALAQLGWLQTALDKMRSRVAHAELLRPWEVIDLEQKQHRILRDLMS
jgi:hypothetical protein